MSTVHQIITEKFLEALNTGTLPWKQPWVGAIHKNAISRNPYRGINRLLLGMSSYPSPWWASWKQVHELIQGKVKDDEVDKWSMVTFSTVHDYGTQQDPRPVWILRYYKVWNQSQCEGGNWPELPKKPNDPIIQAEDIVRHMPQRPHVEYGGNRACYAPKHDWVKVPPMWTFISSEEFYSTTFHELVHATGHAKRLGRFKNDTPEIYDSTEYSFEELVAEIGSSFLCNEAGILNPEVEENSQAYVASWVKALLDKPKMITQAAAAAQNAYDFIMKGSQK